MSGLSLADVFSPGVDGEMPLVSNLLYMVTLAIFVAIGGHRLMVGALLETYVAMPIGHATLPDSLAALIPNLLSESFSLAVRGAAPAMIALVARQRGAGFAQPHVAAIEHSVGGNGIERAGDAGRAGVVDRRDCLVVPGAARSGADNGVWRHCDQHRPEP